MKRVVFKFKDGEHLNIRADYIGLQDGVYGAWDGEACVAYAKQDFVDAVYISEQTERKNER